ncbi:hypothetical protein BOX15_Mlig016243g2 [Macrostomum lignano]|uniref:Uncharacterized protein n=1 Tax=Macrostomum lignano TaxID=282301 RepID=A0A267DR55_9PLAT|nr:hypothetical protein BOX15_Mlig016243g2 [Macrostomum lignano]
MCASCETATSIDCGSGRGTDRQAGRGTDRQAGRGTDHRAGRGTDHQAGRGTDRQAGRGAGSGAGRSANISIKRCSKTDADRVDTARNSSTSKSGSVLTPTRNAFNDDSIQASSSSVENKRRSNCTAPKYFPVGKYFRSSRPDEELIRKHLPGVLLVNTIVVKGYRDWPGRNEPIDVYLNGMCAVNHVVMAVVLFLRQNNAVREMFRLRFGGIRIGTCILRLVDAASLPEAETVLLDAILGSNYRLQFLNKCVFMDSHSVHVDHSQGDEREVIELMLSPILQSTLRMAECSNGHRHEFDSFRYAKESLTFQTEVEKRTIADVIEAEFVRPEVKLCPSITEQGTACQEVMTVAPRRPFPLILIWPAVVGTVDHLQPEVHAGEVQFVLAGITYYANDHYQLRLPFKHHNQEVVYDDRINDKNCLGRIPAGAIPHSAVYFSSAT